MSKFFVCTLVGFVLAAGFASINGALAAPKIDSLVGYWAFDEEKGDTARDYSGNGNDGVLKGGPKWVDGKFGKGLQVGGSKAYVSVPDDESLQVTDAITMPGWTNVTSCDQRVHYRQGWRLFSPTCQRACC